MRISTGLCLGAALILGSAALGGCDDKDSGQQADTPAGHAAAGGQARATSNTGWISANDQHISVWRFVRQPTAPSGSHPIEDGQDTNAAQLAEAVADDALTGIKIAIGANMLPARDSVHAADLVNRALQSADPPGSADPAAEPTAVLVTTPWNDETLLLWIGVPGPMIADTTGVSVEFDPKTVATFRPLGNPSALPVPAAIPGWYGRAAMLYELSPQPDTRPSKLAAGAPALRYGVVHVTGAAAGPATIDRPITAADVIGGIDNAADPVQFAAAVAGFGGLLRGDPALRDLSCNDMIALAEDGALPDPDGWHGQMIAVMRRAEPLIDLPPR
jgi:hypothetical protein